MTTELRRVMAARVAERMSAAGRSPQWLADRAGIDPSTLRRQLDGVDDFTVEDLVGIADALGVVITDLIPRLRELET